MNYKTLNLKETMPTVELALAMIEIELEVCKKEGTQVLKIIHGYGSNGVGGEIKKALKNWLVRSKRQKLFKDFVKGEEWNLNSPKVENIKKICPDVLADFELFSSNPGITLILV